MPAKIEKIGNKWRVINPDTNKIYGIHSNKQSALKQLRALYANIPDMKDKK